jgi:flagellar biosynthesis protein FlhG
MALDHDLDQASGLRRLLNARGALSLTVLGGRAGVGAASCVLNLAVAASMRGRQVLVIDETGRICTQLGITSTHHLALVLSGHCTLSDALIPIGEGLHLLPARYGADSLGQIPQARRAWLTQDCAALEPAPDLILAAAPGRPEQQVISLSLASQAVALVASPDAAALTGAYSLIKTLAQDYGVRQFHLIAARTRGDSEANTVFTNLTQASGRFLGASVRPLGTIPHDPKVAQATRLRRTTLHAFPDSPAASAYREMAERLERLPSGTQDFGGFFERLMENSRITAHIAQTTHVSSQVRT